MLELKNISAGYGKKTVLEGVSATFETGKLTSIIGVNGCGKSTLLKAIIGILPVSGGEILVDETNLQAMSRNEIARKIAYLAQGKNTPDMTVEQMVLHGRFPYLSYPRRYKEADREMAKKAMDAVGIAHLADKSMDTLSGGMRQNAYIAMALAQDTEYILLDEPTTYLDIQHQLELMQLLKELTHTGRGIITVTHDLPLAFRFSDRIAVLKDGAVEAVDTPEKIFASSKTEEIFHVTMGKSEEGIYYVHEIERR